LCRVTLVESELDVPGRQTGLIGALSVGSHWMFHDLERDRMPEMVRENYLEILRRIPLGRKLEIAAEHCDVVREMMAVGIRAERPSISEEGVQRESIKRRLPEDLKRKA